MGSLYTNMADFYQLIKSDEQLLRLLYYKPSNGNDDPLSPTKPNLKNSTIYRDDILKYRMKRAPKIDDIIPKNAPICRLCMYMGSSTRTANVKAFKQRIIFDVFVHIDGYENIDSRSLKIIDRLNEIVNEQHISGMGTVESAAFTPIGNAPEGYIGYQSVFSFGSTK